MEEDRQKGIAASSLVQQFMETGFVRQDENGSFVLPGLSGEKKFRPFEDQ